MNNQFSSFGNFQAFENTYQTVFDNDSRVAINSSFQFPNNSIGWVTNNMQIGNAFLLTPSLALTSAHNFFIETQNGQLFQQNPTQYKFTMLLTKDSSIELFIKQFKINSQYQSIAKKIAQVKAAGKKQLKNSQKRNQYYQQYVALEKEAVKYDFALIKLSGNIIIPRYFQLQAQHPELKTSPNLILSGYLPSFEIQNNRYNYVQKDYFSKKMQLRDGAIHYDFDTKEGLSGSPVHIEGSNTLVGIHKGSLKNHSQSRCTLITREVIQQLKLWDQQINGFNTLQILGQIDKIQIQIVKWGYYQIAQQLNNISNKGEITDLILKVLSTDQQVSCLFQVIPKLINLRRLTLYINHPLIKDTQHDNFVILLNKRPLEMVNILIDPSCQEYQTYDWTSCLMATKIIRKYIKWFILSCNYFQISKEFKKINNIEDITDLIIINSREYLDYVIEEQDNGEQSFNNINVSCLSKTLYRLKGLHRLSLYINHPFIKHQVFDEYVTLLNERKLEKINVFTRQSSHSYSTYHWARRLTAKTVTIHNDYSFY